MFGDTDHPSQLTVCVNASNKVLPQASVEHPRALINVNLKGLCRPQERLAKTVMAHHGRQGRAAFPLFLVAISTSTCTRPRSGRPSKCGMMFCRKSGRGMKSASKMATNSYPPAAAASNPACRLPALYPCRTALDGKETLLVRLTRPNVGCAEELLVIFAGPIWAFAYAVGRVCCLVEHISACCCFRP